MRMKELPNGLKNYQGHSFKGDLSKKDFSGADLRGAKFDRSAILQGVKFCEAKTGLQWHRSLVWMIEVLLLCVLTGVLSTVVTNCIVTPLSPDNVHELGSSLLGSISLFVLSIFFALVFIKGVIAGFTRTFLILAIAIPLSLVYDIFIAQKIALILTFLIILPVSLTLILTAIGVGSLAVNLAKTVFEKKGTASATIAIMIAAIVCKLILPTLSFVNIFGLGFAEALSLAMAGMIAYITYGSTKEESREFAWLQKFAIKIVAVTGTSFKDTDLTDADFEGATLKNADFREAIITRTNWLNTKKLSQACIQGTYLEELKIQKLVTSKKGENKKFNDIKDMSKLNLQRAELEGASFVGVNLSEANLQAAKLEGADFAEANLSQANLQAAKLKGTSFIGANLSEAKLQKAQLLNSMLVDTQLYRANLTGACLTGACIQNWGISTETHLGDIQCDYVFMRLTDGRVDRRKPDNDEENFKNGEFSAFIAPFIKTLSLYHKQFTDPSKIGKIETLDLPHQKDADPEAIIFALTKLASKHTDLAFEVVSVYSVKHDIFNVGVAVTSGVAVTTLSSQYKSYFEEYVGLSEQERQSTLSAGNQEQIKKLKRFILAARESKGSYIGASIVIEKVEKLVMNDNSQHIDFTNAQSVTVGDINQVAADTISNAFNKVTQSSAPQELKAELGKLNQAVAEMVKLLPEEKQREVAQDLKTFTDEATSGSPRKKWYDLSAEGLIEAAKAVGEVATPVITAAKTVLTLLAV